MMPAPNQAREAAAVEMGLTSTDGTTRLAVWVARNGRGGLDDSAPVDRDHRAAEMARGQRW